jgi:hypothetical protein
VPPALQQFEEKDHKEFIGLLNEVAA